MLWSYCLIMFIAKELKCNHSGVFFKQEEFEDTKGTIRIRISKRTDNTMTKRKSRKEQTTQWPKEKVEKNRQHNGQKKK